MIGGEPLPSAIVPASSTLRARSRTRGAWLGIVPLFLVLAGCATGGNGAPPEHEGPGERYFLKKEIPLPDLQPDPLEPFNRSMSLVNDGLVVNVIQPVARAYRWAVPRPLRKGLTRATTNLQAPKHVINNLLQAKLGGAWDETRRFAINSTVGLGGFFDPATNLGIEPSPEDTGQTLAFWGWKKSAFLVLPLFGPGTIRDAVGQAGDAAMAPENHLVSSATSTALSGFRLLNAEADRVDAYSRFLQRSYDPYVLTRGLFALERRSAVTDFHIEAPSGATRTLGAALFGFSDPDFPTRSETHQVALPEGRVAIYDLWLQADPAPLVIVLPGFSSHRLGNSALGLAEMIHREGYSVATVSDALNWEFIESSSRAPLPGFPEADAEDVRHALRAILEDVDGRHPGDVSARALVGVSLGGFHALLLAGSAELPVDRVIAVNPPVRLLFGLEQLDDFYNAPLSWREAERTSRIRETLLKAFELGTGEELPEGLLPFTEIEARFLIGLNFRYGLRDILFSTQRRRNLGVLKTPLRGLWRRPAYREISRYSFMEYLHAFLLPDLIAQDPRVSTFEDLARSADLRTREASLRAERDRIFVFANEDDFLVSSEDIDWLCRTIGRGHVTVFKRGGHLGNLGDPSVQKYLVEALSELGAERSTPHSPETRGDPPHCNADGEDAHDPQPERHLELPGQEPHRHGTDVRSAEDQHDESQSAGQVEPPLHEVLEGPGVLGSRATGANP